MYMGICFVVCRGHVRHVESVLPGNVTDLQSIDISLGSFNKLPALKLPEITDPITFSTFRFSKETAGGANITLNLFDGANPPFFDIVDFKLSIFILSSC